MSGVYMHFYSSNLYGVMFKVTLFVQQGVALIISQNGYQILFVTSSNGWWHDPTPQKALSQPFIVELNLLIVL